MKINIARGVFTDLIEEFGHKSSFDMFIDLDEKLKGNIDDYKITKTKGNSFEANELNSSIKYEVQTKFLQSKQEYSNIINSDEFKKIQSKLVALEIEMIQSRCFLNMDIKLGITKRLMKSGDIVEYIIARAPFYRPEYKRSELTVYLGSTDEYGNDLEKLKSDNEFMSHAYEELRDVMIKEMKL